MKIRAQNTIIHIGMPKAASTSLQLNFFTKLPLINYSGIGAANIISIESLKRVIFEDNANYKKEEVSKGIKTGFNNKLPTVLSHENACMPRLKQFIKLPQEREIIAKRFKELYPEAKILIIIRNQYKIHQSMYVQKLKGERNNIPIKKISFSKWVDWNRELDKKEEENVFQFADYYSILKLYNNLFNEVKVVVFEEMIKEMPDFIENELCPFIGIDAKKAMQYFSNKTKNHRRSKTSIFVEDTIRVTLNFFREKLGNPQKAIPIEKRKQVMKRIHKIAHYIPFGKIDTNYSNEQKRFIENYYAEGNRKVSELTGIDLKSYGYPG